MGDAITPCRQCNYPPQATQLPSTGNLITLHRQHTAPLQALRYTSTCTVYTSTCTVYTSTNTVINLYSTVYTSTCTVINLNRLRNNTQ